MRAAELPLPPNPSAAAALEIVMADCLDRLAINAPRVKAAKPDSLHQVRVAVRRLHAAVKLFAAVLPRSVMSHILGELKWLRRELSAAREFDVFLDEFLVPWTEQQRAADPAVAALHRYSLAQRRLAYRSARAALRSARFQELLAFIGTLTKIKVTGSRSRRLAHRLPAPELVEPVLAALRRKIVGARRLEKMDLHRLHKLRLRAKRMRYTIEFVAGLYPDRRNRRRITGMLAALGQLQSALGDVNDLHARRAIIARARSAAMPRHGGGKMAGSIAAQAADRDIDRRLAKFLNKAVDGYDRFRRIDPFWT